ncbi:MAG: hypothetical protein H7835_17310 [Magnetococcus sp. XQGC-1]
MELKPRRAVVFMRIACYVNKGDGRSAAIPFSRADVGVVGVRRSHGGRAMCTIIQPL